MKDELAVLQQKYVICPIDKATGNFSFICKRFYAQVLAKELGLVGGQPSETYQHCEENNADDVISQNLEDIKTKFKIETHHDDKKLPHMYWLPKKHKTPTKFRFIVAAPACSVKQLARKLTSVFKLFYRQLEQYHQKVAFFTGVKSFWCVQNSEPIKRSISKINSRNKASSVTTYDFSTLYTKIPHDKLNDVLNKLIDFCFDGGECKFIAINKYGAKWVQNKSSCNVCFDKLTLKKAVAYLLENCYFTVGNALFRQLIGIPMGSDPAPFFANLFLYYFENEFLKKLKKSDLSKARKFCNTFRFVDDLGALNDGGCFDLFWKEIYPSELELEKQNAEVSKASLLELDISLANNAFETKLFDKRDSFPFEISRMPHVSSNAPTKIFYSALGAEVLRIARATTKPCDFFVSGRNLINRMKKQGGISSKIKRTLSKLHSKHLSDFSNFSSSTVEFTDQLLV